MPVPQRGLAVAYWRVLSIFRAGKTPAWVVTSSSETTSRFIVCVSRSLIEYCHCLPTKRGNFSKGFSGPLAVDESLPGQGHCSGRRVHRFHLQVLEYGE